MASDREDEILSGKSRHGTFKLRLQPLVLGEEERMVRSDYENTLDTLL